MSDPAAADGASGRWSRFDSGAAALTAVVTLVTFGVAITTTPTSGPYCQANCTAYPYTDIAATIPADFIWMYPALLVSPLFVALVSAIHDRAPRDRRRFSRLAFGFALLAAGILSADYFVQLRVVQPSILLGETAGLQVWTQNNPHGVFIALEEAGYLFMALAFPFACLAVGGRGRLERAARWVLASGFVLVLAFLTGYSAVYGLHPEYRFEVAVIAVDWTVLIIVGLIFAVLWRRTPGRVLEDVPGAAAPWT